MTNKLLKKYQSKRDFSKTPEPSGRDLRKARKPIFVIQKHSARSLHYDFRLEDEGILKSWAIPKGPSTNPQEKRLAVMTEDHPFDYKDFEGIIPTGNYGAGAVIIWDHGIYKNLKSKPLHECIKEGAVSIWIEGTKLHGGFALIRTHFSDNSWLFFKMKDEEVDLLHNIIKELPESVVSGKTIEDLTLNKKKS